MFEYLQTAGAFIGLLTGLFVFYDRYARGRPLASLSFEKEGDRTSAKLRISNPGPYDVAVLNISCVPEVYRLSPDTELRKIIHAAMGAPLFFVLAPNESRSLHLVALIKDGVALEMEPQRIRFCVSWRRSSSTWLWQVPLVVHADTSFIRKFALDGK